MLEVDTLIFSVPVPVAFGTWDPTGQHISEFHGAKFSEARLKPLSQGGHCAAEWQPLQCTTRWNGLKGLLC